jgi:hypothetical protein
MALMPVVYGFRSMINTVVPGFAGLLEDEQVREVQASVIAREFEIGRAVVVGHGSSFVGNCLAFVVLRQIDRLGGLCGVPCRFLIPVDRARMWVIADHGIMVIFWAVHRARGSP